MLDAMLCRWKDLSFPAFCEVCSVGCQSFKRGRLSRLDNLSSITKVEEKAYVTALKCNGLAQTNVDHFRLRLP